MVSKQSTNTSSKERGFQSSVQVHEELVQSEKDIQKIADHLKTQSIIAFDTEFIRETTFYPKLEIIQVASASEAWLIDAQIAQEDPERKAFLDPILEVFQDPKIIKLVHAGLGDQECLYTSFGVLARNVFDTAIGASLCGLGDGIGLANLLKTLQGVRIKKGQIGRAHV